MNLVIAKLKARENLSPDEMQAAMQAIVLGQASAEQISQFLLALREKGPSILELTSAARYLREQALKVPFAAPLIFDTCGTGGDKSGTFNVSTLVALVVAACGVVVAKHGNRSVSSLCGSADILESLGVNIHLSPEDMAVCLKEVGLAFLFAQRLHPAMKNVAPIRKALGVETIFNILGPLINPVGTTHQLVGVYRQDLVLPLTEVLRNLGLKRVMVVHAADGLDEVTTTATTFVGEYDGTTMKEYAIHPSDFGISVATAEELKGGDLGINRRIAELILDGAPGPKTDLVVLNAACALYTAAVVENIAEGITLARLCLREGRAKEKLQQLKEFTHRGA